MAYTDIDDPSVYFQIKLYSEAGAYTFDGNSDMQPDFVWIKERNGTNEHNLFDSVRGTTKRLESSTNAAEQTSSTTLTAFGSDGFTVGNNPGTGQNGGNYVGWGWKVNGSGSENTVGDLTVTALSVNQTAGISIGKIVNGFTSTSSNSETVGHGLGAIPQVIIVKNTEATGDWQVYHVGIGNTKKIRLNSTSAGADSTLFNNTTPTSSVWSVRGGDFATGEDVVFYAFAEKKGYSKFGSYTGNGNADGTFFYTGFKPAFIIQKRSDATHDWQLHDNKRGQYFPGNVVNNRIQPNSNNAEGTGDDIGYDFLSNGFKTRTSNANYNASGSVYIYMAFAENPFVTSTGVPATAR